MLARAWWSGRARVDLAIAHQAVDVDDRLLAGQRGVPARGPGTAAPRKIERYRPPPRLSLRLPTPVRQAQS
jgi:hypothetical protein